MTSSSSNTSPACLAIDCSGRDVYCGLISEDTIRVTPPTNQRSVCSLIPSIKELYQTASIDPNQTSLIAVTYGPGAFTSLRIGITAAKSLGFCYDCPVVGVNSLDVYAAAISNSQSFTGESRRQEKGSKEVHNRKGVRVVPCLNAFRNQVFCKFLVLRSDSNQRKPFTSLVSEQCKRKVDFGGRSASSGESDDRLATDPKFVGGQLLNQGIQAEAYNLKHSQHLETEISVSFFQRHCQTKILDNESFVAEIATDDSEEVVLTGPEDWKNSLIKKEPSLGELLSDGACRWLIPSNEEIIAGIGRVAIETLPFLSNTERNAMALQPVYFRDSAAEENRNN